MAKAEYDWEIGNPATLEPHSLAKHTILRRYVEEYLRILTADPRVPDFRITLVDGFAGGGEYLIKGSSKIHDGSPFILIDAVRTAKIAIDAERSKPITLDASFVFVEKKPSNFLYLRDALGRRFEKGTLSRVNLIQGAFEENLDAIIASIKSVKGRKPRPIFVLDQYGYSDVPIEMISKIMRELPTAELFLTLAFGWIGAYARGPQAQTSHQTTRSLRCGTSNSSFTRGSPSRAGPGVTRPFSSRHAAATGPTGSCTWRTASGRTRS